MTAVDRLITSVRKHMKRNHERRGWSGLKNWEKEIETLAEEAYAETSARDGFAISPPEWAAHAHRIIVDRLPKGHRLPYAVETSHVIKDGDMSKSYGQLLVQYVTPAALELLDLIACVAAQGPPQSIPQGAYIGTADDQRVTVRVSAFYDSKTAGTRIVYLVK